MGAMADYTVEVAGLTVNQLPSGSGGSTPSSVTMTQIPEADWWSFYWTVTSHECDENCFNGGVFKNPLIPVSTTCTCTHADSAHYKGKKCRMYACPCQKFTPDEDV